MIRAATNGVVRLPKAKNVLGGKLEICCTSPMTGFFRDGCCNTGPEDVGSHTVCIQVTAKFLEFSKAAGNDLSTPMLQYGFPGLREGDRWCLCAPRWQERSTPASRRRSISRRRTRRRWPIAIWKISRPTLSMRVDGVTRRGRRR